MYRLEHQGLITAEWGESENNRKAKFYELTRAGRKRLREEAASWNRLAAAIAAAMNATLDDAGRKCPRGRARLAEAKERKIASTVSTATCRR